MSGWVVREKKTLSNYDDYYKIVNYNGELHFEEISTTLLVSYDTKKNSNLRHPEFLFTKTNYKSVL